MISANTKALPLDHQAQALHHEIKREKPVDELAQASLGSSRNSVEQKSRSKRRQRYKLQRFAGKLLPGFSVGKCSCATIPNKPVQVKLGKKGASFSGVMRCGSVWTCPVCSARISVRRAEELNLAIEAHENEAGGIVLLMTLTVQHTRSDNLKELQDDFLRAEKALKQGKVWRDLNARLVGSVRALEVTRGANGWHPHSHTLLFWQGGDLEAAKEAANKLRKAWTKSLAKQGRRCGRAGFDLRYGKAAASYMTKWGLAAETAMSHEKKGKSSRTPWEILASAADGDEKDAALFRVFAQALKGKRQLTWSRGLKELYEIEERTDEQLADEQAEDGAEVVATITKDDWGKVVLVGFQCRVLEGAEVAGEKGVARVISLAHEAVERRRREWHEEWQRTGVRPAGAFR